MRVLLGKAMKSSTESFESLAMTGSFFKKVYSRYLIKGRAGHSLVFQHYPFNIFLSEPLPLFMKF